MKTYRVNVTKTAKKDIEKIYRYLNELNPSAAKKWKLNVLSIIRDLKIMPNRGSSVEKYEKIRNVFFKLNAGGVVYRVIYKTDEENARVYILTVLNGKRNVLDI